MESIAVRILAAQSHDVVIGLPAAWAEQSTQLLQHGWIGPFKQSRNAGITSSGPQSGSVKALPPAYAGRIALQCISSTVGEKPDNCGAYKFALLVGQVGQFSKQAPSSSAAVLASLAATASELPAGELNSMALAAAAGAGVAGPDTAGRTAWESFKPRGCLGDAPWWLFKGHVLYQLSSASASLRPGAKRQRRASSAAQSSRSLGSDDGMASASVTDLAATPPVTDGAYTQAAPPIASMGVMPLLTALSGSGTLPTGLVMAAQHWQHQPAYAEAAQDWGRDDLSRVKFNEIGDAPGPLNCTSHGLLDSSFFDNLDWGSHEQVGNSFMQQQPQLPPGSSQHLQLGDEDMQDWKMLMLPCDAPHGTHETAWDCLFPLPPLEACLLGGQSQEEAEPARPWSSAGVSADLLGGVPADLLAGLSAGLSAELSAGLSAEVSVELSARPLPSAGGPAHMPESPVSSDRDIDFIAASLSRLQVVDSSSTVSAGQLWANHLHPVFEALLLGKVGICGAGQDQGAAIVRLQHMCEENGLRPGCQATKGLCLWDPSAQEPHAKKNGWRQRTALQLVCTVWPDTAKWRGVEKLLDPVWQAVQGVAAELRAQQVHAIMGLAKLQGATDNQLSKYLEASWGALGHVARARQAPQVAALLDYWRLLPYTEWLLSPDVTDRSPVLKALTRFRRGVGHWPENEEDKADQAEVLRLLLGWYLSRLEETTPKDAARSKLGNFLGVLLSKAAKSKDRDSIDPSRLASACQALGIELPSPATLSPLGGVV